MNKNILLIGGCGYIGSYIYKNLPKDFFQVEICDLLSRGNPLNIEVTNKDYRDLDALYLNKFDAVIWFAGHSSVSQSINEPIDAVKNNCIGLFELALKLKDNTKFIYASSASLYSSASEDIQESSEDSLNHIPQNNAYDASKFAFDYLAKNFLKNYYGLRMGTLCGYSPNIRNELVFNSMNISAHENKFIRLMNRGSWRSILFLEDLSRFVNKILLTDVSPGFYNLSSRTLTMQDLADKIANVWNVPVLDEGFSPTYSFKINNRKMLNIIEINDTELFFEKQCLDLIESKRNYE